MKKLIYLPVCLGMLFFSAACENWFDVSPKSDVKICSNRKAVFGMC